MITQAIRKSFLMLVSDLGFIASQYIDRYLITLFLGLRVAGIYFLFWTVGSSATTFLALVLQQKQRPLLISAYRTGGPPHTVSWLGASCRRRLLPRRRSALRSA